MQTSHRRIPAALASTTIAANGLGPRPGHPVHRPRLAVPQLRLGRRQAGMAGLGVAGYQAGQFDNPNVTPGTGSVTLPTGPVTSGIAGTCLDDYGGSAVNGTKADR